MIKKNLIIILLSNTICITSLKFLGDILYIVLLLFSISKLSCWETFTGYNSFVRDKWHSLRIEGWGDYVLKEKLKSIKLALKEWHMQH